MGYFYEDRIMIKVYKFKAKENINNNKLRVAQTYRFTPNKEYIGRYTQFNTILIYDYYLKEINKCDGFTYICECMNSDFCPMYETEEMLKKRKKMFNRNKK